MAKSSSYRLGRRLKTPSRDRLDYQTYRASAAKPIPKPPVVPYTDAADVIAKLGTDLIEFWDADTLASLTIVNTDKVSSWVGLKASGVVPVQATDANRPIYNSTQWGSGKPSLAFGSTTRRLTAPAIVALPDGSTPFEVWMLVDQKSGAGTQRLLNFPGTTNALQFVIAHTQSGAEERLVVSAGTGTTQVNLTASPVFTGKKVIRARADATRLYAGMDDAAKSGSMANVGNVLGGLPATGILAFGAGTSGGSIWTGLIRKILITKKLSSDQALKLLGYLEAQK